MTDEQLNHFRDLLEAMREELAANLAQEDPTKDSISPDKSIGRLTRMEAIQAQAMSGEGRRRQQIRLDQVLRALERIEGGQYGTCVRCGDEIPAGRLEIMPEAPFCMKCASR
jgi:DnaK suppressor protein